MSRSVRIPRSTPTIVFASMLGFLVSVQAALGAPWDPRRASDVVMLRCFDASATCALASLQGVRVNRDGTVTNFVLPAGQVFVGNAIEITAFNGTPGTAVSVFFNLGPLGEIMRADGVYNDDGVFTARREFPTGFVYNAAASPTFTVNPLIGPIVGRLVGFLAPDK